LEICDSDRQSVVHGWRSADPLINAQTISKHLIDSIRASVNVAFVSTYSHFGERSTLFRVNGESAVGP